MTYKYKCGNEIIRVFVWNDDFHNEVSVEDTKTRKSYDRTIREDEKGKFFTWNRNKIYLNDWIKILRFFCLNRILFMDFFICIMPSNYD